MIQEAKDATKQHPVNNMSEHSYNHKYGRNT